MNQYRKTLFKLKTLTDSGILFKIRCRLLYLLFLFVNIDVFFTLLFDKKPDLKNRGKTIGIFSVYRPLFWHGNIFETRMNQEFVVRGYCPIHILCKGCLPICNVHSYRSNKEINPGVCKDCYLRNKLYYRRNKSEVIYIDDFIHDTDFTQVFLEIDHIKSIDEAKNYSYKEMNIGHMCELSVCRYLMRLTLSLDHLPIYKQYLKSAVIVYKAFLRIQNKYRFVNFLIFNGRYIIHGIPLVLIKKMGLPFHTYEFSELQNMLYSANDISIMWNEVDEKFNKWCLGQKFSRELKNKIDLYMERRREKQISYYMDLKEDIDNKKTNVVVFTNIVWDSAAFDREVAFENQFEWITELIGWAKEHPDRNMVIRVHPAERNSIYNKTMECMDDYIDRQFPSLPNNVSLIASSERKNSYSLLKQAKVILTYSSSIGLEAALEGYCVITAAWAHYVRNGIVLAPKTKEAYFIELNKQLHADQRFKSDPQLVNLYVYWYYHAHHRLVHTNLYKKPFIKYEESAFLRVPRVDAKIISSEIDAMVEEFLNNVPPQGKVDKYE